MTPQTVIGVAILLFGAVVMWQGVFQMLQSLSPERRGFWLFRMASRFWARLIGALLIVAGGVFAFAGAQLFLGFRQLGFG